MQRRAMVGIEVCAEWAIVADFSTARSRRMMLSVISSNVALFVAKSGTSASIALDLVAVRTLNRPPRLR